MVNQQQLREQVLHYFRVVGSGQNMIQCIKEVLFLHEQFNPVFIFEKLSKGKQRISSKNWRDYLLHINLDFTERQFRYFMKHNEYKSETTLNEFLQSIIPYNGDVVREYKQKCTDSIKIHENNKEIDYIFAELIENQFKLFRMLINIRDEITTIASIKDIDSLVKKDLLEDLDKHGLCREHRKLLENFQTKGFKLSFQELRKFFKIWVPEKVIVHELCMLNVMRHLKSHDPFCKIVFKKKRKAIIEENSAAKRLSPSKSLNDSTPHGSQEKHNQKIQQSPYEKQLNLYGPDNKYNEFKNKLLEQFHQTQKKSLLKQDADYSNRKSSHQNSSHKQKQTIQQKNSHPNDKQLYRRPKSYEKSYDSSGKYNQNIKYPYQQYKAELKAHLSEESIIFKFLQQIIIKEQKIQRLRKQLAKNNDFNLINLYKMVDSKSKGFITSKDIADYPEAQKAYYLYMINFYGREYDKLLFHQFCQIFRPLSRQLNEAIDSRPENKVPVSIYLTKNPFKRQTRRLIIDILKETAEEHFNLHKMREGMRRINPKQLFIILDVYNKGYIDSDTFLTVFKQNNIYCDDKSLKCLMKLWRKRIDERITFNEFLKFIEV